MGKSETQLLIMSMSYELINAISNTLSNRTDVAPVAIAVPWGITQYGAA